MTLDPKYRTEKHKKLKGWALAIGAKMERHQREIENDIEEFINFAK